MPDALHPDSRAVHAGRADLRGLGVHALPIDLSTTYPFESLDDAVGSLDAMMAGAAPTAGGPVYSRLHSPTVARFEAGLAELEGAEASVAFASGMAALTAAVLAAREDGKDHVVGVRPIYGTTDRLLSSGLLGLAVTWTDEAGVAEAVRPDTALVVVETPVNPTLDLVDVAAVARAAGDVPVLVDSTFATPVLQRPLALGAALVMHSATKFIGGHGDVLAGVVACSAEWAGPAPPGPHPDRRRAPPAGGVPPPPRAGDAAAPGAAGRGDRDGAGGPPLGRIRAWGPCTTRAWPAATRAGWSGPRWTGPARWCRSRSWAPTARPTARPPPPPPTGSSGGSGWRRRPSAWARRTRSSSTRPGSPSASRPGPAA